MDGTDSRDWLDKLLWAEKPWRRGWLRLAGVAFNIMLNKSIVSHQGGALLFEPCFLRQSSFEGGNQAGRNGGVPVSTHWKVEA